jgi:HEPN domain-containing protein
MNADESIVEWVRLVQMDIATANHMFNTYWPKPIEVVCYHSQQATEKILKCYLVLNGIEVPKIHDTDILCDKCIKIDPNFGEIYDSVVCLTSYAVAPRYPADFELTEQDARDAIKRTRAVMDFVGDILRPHLMEAIADICQARLENSQKNVDPDEYNPTYAREDIARFVKDKYPDVLADEDLNAILDGMDFELHVGD